MINIQEECLHLEERKVKLMEACGWRRGPKPTKTLIFLISLLLFIKKLGDIQCLEVRKGFLSSVTRKIQISKNLSERFNNVPTASNISFPPPTPSPRGSSLDSTRSRKSDASNTHTADDLRLKRRFTATSVSGLILRASKGGYSYCRRRRMFYSSVYVLVDFEIFQAVMLKQNQRLRWSSG